MRRLFTSASLLGLLAFGACGDDKTTPPAEDTTTQTDTTPADTADDTATPDTATPDTATPDTATPDTATPDTTETDTNVEPPDFGEGTCPGMIACLDLCADETCEAACLAAADSEAETAALTALGACLEENECLPASDTPTDEEERASASCAREHCVAETVTCFQGETAGAGRCPALRGCVRECDEDYACVRACFAAATLENVEFYVQLELCLDAQCIGTTDPAGEENCRTEAMKSTQPCAVEANQCGIGAIGGAPGAGAGGGE